MQLLRYLTALARERHFARAAASCNVSQPTLSAGLAALEEQLGRRLVERDRRFIGLTPEGEAVLPWAQQVLAAADGMVQALDGPEAPLAGELRLGVIPAAMPVVGHLSRVLCAAHPDLVVSIQSLTSRQIQSGLAASELDGGLTYLDHEPAGNVLRVPLYAERYMFVAPADRSYGTDGVSWETVLGERLCLLHQGMQNRRILDTHLSARGLVLRPHVTSDSYFALAALVETGAFATIIPDSYAGLLGDARWVKLLPFREPLPESRIGLILVDRKPLGRLAAALLAGARSLALPPQFRRC